MTQRPLDRLIRPQTIAVFGGREARRVIEQCDRMGFLGEIWPVHPTLDAVLGRRCYRSVRRPARRTGCRLRRRQPDADHRYRSRALSDRGAGGAVCYASGFSEAVAELADGADLQRALVEAAGPMPIVGPNCYGLINGLDGALLWPDQHGMVRVERGVAILTQSSNIAINLSMQKRGLPITLSDDGGQPGADRDCRTSPSQFSKILRVTADRLAHRRVRQRPDTSETCPCARGAAQTRRRFEGRQIRTGAARRCLAYGIPAGSDAVARRSSRPSRDRPRRNAAGARSSTLKLLHRDRPTGEQCDLFNELFGRRSSLTGRCGDRPGRVIFAP